MKLESVEHGNVWVFQRCDGNILFVYWGTKSSYLLTRKLVLLPSSNMIRFLLGYFWKTKPGLFIGLEFIYERSVQVEMFYINYIGCVTEGFLHTVKQLSPNS